MLLYHGTTSSRAEAILRDGFRLPASLAPDIAGAAHYASCGGEWDLQEREEAFHAEHGEWPRELYDTVEMHRLLYPAGETPAVVVVDLPDGFVRGLAADAGADGGLVAETALPPGCVVGIVALGWDPDDACYPTPLEAGPSPAP